MTLSNVVIDLSHHNPDPDFNAVAAAGIVGVIHKATQGTGFFDQKYAERRQPAADSGLLWGAYHFGTGSDPVQQANWFLQQANPGPQDLVVLDFEPNPGGTTMTLEQARIFIQAVQARIGRPLGFYGGSLIRQTLGNAVDPLLGGCWLWWAQYGGSANIVSNWSNFTLWQYTDGHSGVIQPMSVDGVGPCDRDQYFGTVDQLRAAWATGTLVAQPASVVAAASAGGNGS